MEDATRAIVRRNQSREYYRKRAAAGQCQNCRQAALPGKSNCANCHERRRAQKHKRHRQRADAGLCQDCNQMAMPGKPLCASCREQATQRKRELRQRRNAGKENTPMSTDPPQRHSGKR